MASTMIDIGINLFNSQFNADRDSVLDEAYTAGVQALLLTGTDLEVSQRSAAFCASRRVAGNTTPACFATAGVHPHHAGELPPNWQQRLAAILQQPDVVAHGEMGLDYFRNFSEPNVQRSCFAAQLELAVDSTLPLFVHDRDAAADTLNILRRGVLARPGATDLSAVVVHCFTGAADALRAYLEAGCYIGITGWVCDERRGQGLREIVTQIPLNRLLIETDAPFLRPHNAPPGSGRNKRRNSPGLLPYVAAALADIYAISKEELATHTANNARALFQLHASVPGPRTSAATADATASTPVQP